MRAVESAFALGFELLALAVADHAVVSCYAFRNRYAIGINFPSNW